MNKTNAAFLGILLLASVAIAFVPAASAHVCAGPDCGACDGGKNEVHIRTDAATQSCVNCSSCNMMDFVALPE
ncbi:MAG TPA: hypothetical protein VM241_07335 [Candidatus Thermoplasmatota archaeon]|nr:hypothetical protein [Candidatus Thermoplasmatota archaeon]